MGMPSSRRSERSSRESIGDVWELCTCVGMAGRLEESDLRLPAVRALAATPARNATGTPPRGDEYVGRLDAVHDVRRR
jgi:hypothetical protein